MSRCLPFPPPNYVKNGLGGDKLLQQLELRRKKAEYAKKKEEEKRKEEKEKKNREKKRSHDDNGNDKKKKRKEAKREKKRSHNKKMSTTQEGEKKHDVSPSSDIIVEEDEKKETSKEYKKLIENWFPLPLQMVPTDFENDEWLSRKNDSNGETETTDPTKHVSSSSSSTADMIKQGIQPLAYYLPNADIYALPYILPF